MSKMVRIRGVPDEEHREWRRKAALQGRSLSEYLLRELRRSSTTPTMEEWLERVRNRPPVAPSVDLAGVIREGRDQRWAGERGASQRGGRGGLKV
ncbi:MAG TPA: hypothetical protein VIC54_02115 [Terriglobales bacterium]